MIRGAVRALFELRESPVRWPIGLQAAIAVGVPVAAFTLAGAESFGIMASMGAFASLYGAALSRVRRALVLPIIVIGLVLAAIIGVSAAWSFPLTLVALFAVAVVATVLCLGAGVGPPGPIFFVLITGVTGFLTADTDAGGVGRDPVTVVAAVTVGSVFAYLVVISPLIVPHVWRREVARFRGERSTMPRRFDFGAEARSITMRIAVAAALAVGVSAPLGIERAYWIVCAAVAILQNVVHLRFTAVRAAHRLLGTFLGVAVYALVAILEPNGLWLALVFATFQFTIELLVTRNYGLALALITPMALLISTHGHAGDVAKVVRERTFDTFLGSVIAVAVLLGVWGMRRWRSGRLAQLP